MAVFTFREFEEVFERIRQGLDRAKAGSGTRTDTGTMLASPVPVPDRDEMEARVRDWYEEQMRLLKEYTDACDSFMAYADEAHREISGCETLIRSKVGKPELNARLEQEARARASSFPLPFTSDPWEDTRILQDLADRVMREATALPSVSGLFASYTQDHVNAYARIISWYNVCRSILPLFNEVFEKKRRGIEQEAADRLSRVDREYQEALLRASADRRQREEEAARLSRMEEETAARNEAMAAESVLKRFLPPAALTAVPAGPSQAGGAMQLDLTALGGAAGAIRRTYRLSAGASVLSVPCCLQAGDLSPVVLVTGDDTSKVSRVLEPMILTGFLSRPVGGAMLTVCTASGANVDYRLLDTLIRSFPEATHGRIFSGRTAAEQILKGHAAVMQSLLHGPLAGGKHVRDYNAKAEKKIPARYLLITGFPMNFSQDMLALTANLVRDGERCGIRLLIQKDRSAPVPGGSDAGMWIEKILDGAVVFEDKGPFLQGRNNPLLRYVPERDFPVSAFEKRLRTLYEAEKKKKNRTYSLEDILPRTQYLKGDAGELLEIPFAVTGDGGTCCLRMGDKVANGTSHFALMIGPTGSGKSVALHTIIMASMLKYRPSELQLILMDFKEGTEFKIYENYKIPNLQFISVDSVQQFGESILKRLCLLMEERAELFRKASLETGIEIKNLPDYRRAGRKMARILVVTDEFQVLFNMAQDRKSAMRAAAHFGELISKGRSYGIHFIMATQTLQKISSGDYSISRASMEEMHIRLALQCNEKEMTAIMGEKRGRACMDLLTGQKGSLVYLENDLVGTPVGARAIYVKPEVQQQILAALEKAYSGLRFSRARVFRGAETPLAGKDLLEKGKERKALILGEPIAIGAPVAIEMAGMTKKNLLVLGESAEMEKTILKLVLAQIPSLAGRLFFMDGEALQGGGDALYAFAKESCASSACRLTPASNPFRVVAMVREAYRIFLDRKRRMASGTDTEADRVPVFFLVRGMQLIEPIGRMMQNLGVEDFDMEGPAEAVPAPAPAGSGAGAGGKNPFTDLLAGLPGTAPSESASPGPGALREELSGMLEEMGRDLAEGPGKGGGPSAPAGRAGEKEPDPCRQLHTLIDSGYMCSVHLIMTCGDYSALSGVMTRDLMGFSNRIIMKTASPRAASYISTDINPASIRDNMVIFSDGKKEPLLMRPYRTEGEK